VAAAVSLTAGSGSDQAGEEAGKDTLSLLPVYSEGRRREGSRLWGEVFQPCPRAAAPAYRELGIDSKIR